MLCFHFTFVLFLGNSVQKCLPEIYSLLIGGWRSCDDLKDVYKDILDHVIFRSVMDDGLESVAKVKLIDFKDRNRSLSTQVLLQRLNAMFTVQLCFLLNSAESVLWHSIIIYELCYKALFTEILGWLVTGLPCFWNWYASEENDKSLCKYNLWEWSNNQNFSAYFMCNVLIHSFVC